MTGDFRQSIIEAGELEAIRASNIMMPRIGYQYGFQFKLVGLEEHGKIVRKGDSVIKLDASSVYKYIIEREDQLENELAAATKQAVQSENNIQELTAQLKIEQSSYDLKKLELERSSFDTPYKKKIKELEFQQATIKLNNVKRKLELKPILDNYDKRIQRIRVLQRQSELKSAKETLKFFLIKSPGDGTFQVASNRNYMNPQQWKLGDSPYQGYIIASIPDLSHMKVKSYINEADFRKVKPGMKVIVRLDALPGVPFTGTITDISKICFAREKEKVFNVEVAVNESDIRLKPGMTVSCEYICNQTDTCMYVPNSCLYKENGHTFVFLSRGREPDKIEVTPGPSNSTHTVITGTLKSGQRLVPVEKVLTPKNI